MTKLCHTLDTVLEVAAKKSRLGFRVVAVNSGNAYQVGGAFLTGGRHGLEEAMCMQSSLFLSLQQAQRLAVESNLRDAKGRKIHIPEAGAVLSPEIEIFRKASGQGYGPMVEDRVMISGVVTVAMPNMNPSLTCTPLEWRSRSQREQLVEKKLNAMLQGAEMVGCEVLVASDIGCGTYGNDARDIGASLGIVLSRYPGRFEEVVICGGARFYEAVCEAVGPGFVVSHKANGHEASLTPKSTTSPSSSPSSTSTLRDLKRSLGNVAKVAMSHFMSRKSLAAPLAPATKDLPPPVPEDLTGTHGGQMPRSIITAVSSSAAVMPRQNTGNNIAPRAAPHAAPAWTGSYARPGSGSQSSRR